jgi:hypothetical protein
LAPKRFGARLILALSCIASAGDAGLSAANAKGPSIEAPAEIKVAPAVVSRLPIRIHLDDGALPQAMLVVRGLPSRVMLSEGRLFSPNVWVAPLTAVGKLEIAPASGTSGRADLVFEITTLDGRVLASARSAFVVESQAANPRQEPAGQSAALTTGTLNAPDLQRETPGARSAPPAPLTLPAETAQKARKMMERGDRSLAEGKVTAARLLYQAAAEMGWAPAAIALAKTYDPNEFQRSTVLRGVLPDAALAQKWYETAKELGSAEAVRRLQALQTAR